MKRKIIRIDDRICDGCGRCLPNCSEGALQIIDHKARLVSDLFCDGLGACIGTCPLGAIAVEEREAEPYDERRVMLDAASELRSWPVQLQLLNPHAPFLAGADLLIAADCVPFAHAGFHQRFLKGKVAVIFCPKLDRSADLYVEKLTTIFKSHDIRSVTVARMEVPCCGGTTELTRQAMRQAGKGIPVREYVVSLGGEIRS